MSVIIEILDIEPDSSYNDVIYDQWIEARLPTGELVQLFDDQILLSDEDINTKVRAVISPVFNISEVSSHPELDYGIEIVDSSSGTEHVYRGQVVQIQSTKDSDNSSEKTVILNVGFGKVCFAVQDLSDINLNVNDEIALPAFRSDLVDIEGPN